jgi:hypothetical protein
MYKENKGVLNLKSNEKNRILVVLLETKGNDEEQKGISYSVWNNYEFIHLVGSKGLSRGLAILWNP